MKDMKDKDKQIDNDVADLGKGVAQLRAIANDMGQVFKMIRI